MRGALGTTIAVLRIGIGAAGAVVDAERTVRSYFVSAFVWIGVMVWREAQGRRLTGSKAAENIRAVTRLEVSSMRTTLVH